MFKTACGAPDSSCLHGAWHTQATDDVCVVQVGGEVDKLCETKGLDFVDREKAKRHAREQVSQVPPCSGSLPCRFTSALVFWPCKSKRACSDSTMGKYRPILSFAAYYFAVSIGVCLITFTYKVSLC